MRSKQLLIEKYIGPSEIELITVTGHLIERWLDKYGDKHSILGQPAVVAKCNTGRITYKEWYKKGQHHREKDLPSYVGYNSDGQTYYQEWYKNGKYKKHGTWYSNGKYKKTIY
jgi:hypothetical protein